MFLNAHLCASFIGFSRFHVYGWDFEDGQRSVWLHRRSLLLKQI